MKVFAALLLLASTTLAFPHLEDSAFARRQSGPYSMPPQGKGANPSKPPPFDAKAQLVKTSGTHAWRAPGSKDSRGPCPGLNAAANHNYLPRSGYSTILQFVSGTHDAFGMAPDLSLFLAVVGAVGDGSLIGWLIGGEPHTGIGGSHGNYETDSSPLRADMNQYGSNTKLVMAQFRRLYAMQPDPATANYNLEVLRDFRATRLADSERMNPYYYYGPVSGVAVSQAAHVFIYRFFANKSAEYPEGILTRDVLKSFMSISGPEDNLKHTPGHERIPDNWYRRNDADLFGLFSLGQDANYIGAKVPHINDVGCNNGTVNSFRKIDIATLTGGVYNDELVAKNPLCFAGATLQASAASLLGVGGVVLELLNAVLTPLITNCPEIRDINYAELKKCPGFSLFGGPLGLVAPGAIQEE